MCSHGPEVRNMSAARLALLTSVCGLYNCVMLVIFINMLSSSEERKLSAIITHKTLNILSAHTSFNAMSLLDQKKQRKSILKVKAEQVTLKISSARILATNTYFLKNFYKPNIHLRPLEPSVHFGLNPNCIGFVQRTSIQIVG